MQYENIVELVLEYAAAFKVADMRDPDELQEAESQFSYYCAERFTAEEKELICRFATERALKLREKLRREDSPARRLEDPNYAYHREALEKEIAFYEGVPGTLYYLDHDH